jgi:hypothetical protein
VIRDGAEDGLHRLADRCSGWQRRLLWSRSGVTGLP